MSDKLERTPGPLVRLKRDIVIPAGTIFKPAPIRTSRTDGHFEHTIAIGKDNTASLVVFMQHDPETMDWLEGVEQQ